MQEQQTNKVGRKPAAQSDAISLNEILLSQDKRKALLFQLKRLDKDIELHKQRSDALREDLKDSAEGFGLSVKKFKELLSDLSSGELEEKINTLTSTVDVLTILKEDSDKDGM